MAKVICECGYSNPEGTDLCEACGKPLNEKAKQQTLVDMRYEGVARRSQTYNKSIVDKVWNFFSSVKVGIWIIILTLLASSLGTIFPQEMYIPNNVSAAEHYQEEYGVLGQIYYTLGLHNMYSSWWYMALIASLGISLIIASLDRVVPLYRVLKHQKVSRNEGFLRRQRMFGEMTVPAGENQLEAAKHILKKRKFKIREEGDNLVAEKGRFSRWGPYVNHVGLIIFLTGAMLRFFPGMYVDEVVWVREGETEVVPGTDGEYFVENEQFFLEMYDEDDETFATALERAGGNIVETFQTDAIVYEREEGGTIGEEPDLQELKRDEIRVNEPLTFDGFSLYQVDYKLNELNVMSLEMVNRETGESVGELQIDLFNPESEYDLGDGYRVVIDSYFPNFEFNEEGEPSTISSIPDNPAFIFQMFSPEHEEEGEYSFVGIQRNEDVFGENDYEMSFQNVETKNVTGLTVRKDNTLPFIAAGGIIFMIGLIQGSYWSHRRVWLKKENGKLLYAGHANKHWQTLKRDFDALYEEAGISPPVDQVAEKEQAEEKKKQQEGGS